MTICNDRFARSCRRATALIGLVFVTLLFALAARAASPGLLAHYQFAGDDRAPEQYLHISTRPQFVDILRAAPPGTVDPSVDPDDVFDVMLGTMLARAIVPAVAARRTSIDRTVDLLVRMLRPAA